MVEVKPAITSVAVRKPKKHEFVRVRKGSDWRFETACFDDKEAREVYLVAPELWPAMLGDVTHTCLVVDGNRTVGHKSLHTNTINQTAQAGDAQNDALKRFHEILTCEHELTSDQVTIISEAGRRCGLFDPLSIPNG